MTDRFLMYGDADKFVLTYEGRPNRQIS